MKHGEVKQSIPRPHPRPSCLCGPSITLFAGQSDPESAPPDENNDQGATPGPKMRQASSLPAPLVCGHSLLSSHCLLFTHILQGCGNPVLAQEASSSARSCQSLCSFPPANLLRAGGLLAPTVYMWNIGGDKAAVAHKGLSTQDTMAPLCPRAGALAQAASQPPGIQELNGICCTLHLVSLPFPRPAGTVCGPKGLPLGRPG